MSGEENRHCIAFMLWEGSVWRGCIHERVFLCWIEYDGLRLSVYRQARGTSRRQQRPEALIYHQTVIRHTFLCVRTR